MNKLIAELQRLYFFPDGPLGADTFAALELVSADGQVRAMCIDFKKSTDWAQVASLFRTVQEALGLPAPAVSVSGKGGFQLWFSLAECVSIKQARQFMEAIRFKFLSDMPLSRLQFHPGLGNAPAEPNSVDLPPARHAATKWSAFIDPSLGSLFIDEPWLEMAPNFDRQAKLLAEFESIKVGDFQTALNTTLQSGETHTGSGKFEAPFPLNVGDNFHDPKSFLLAVMNDRSASTDQRIEAAKALWPYFETSAGRLV